MSEIWHSAILPIKVETLLESAIRAGFIPEGTPTDSPIYEEIVAINSSYTLLPSLGKYSFIADPFGIWREDHLYVFTEAYDYSNRKGRIDVFTYSRDFKLIRHHPAVLRTDWHLSYPNILLHNGEYYMLPEAWKSGKLTMYKAKKFPTEWEEVSGFNFPVGSIDSTPFMFKEKWYMLWTPPQPREARQASLCLAEAPDLFGPWELKGELAMGLQGSRCGGTPIVKGETVYAPVQDCRKDYGAGIRYLEINGLGAGKIKIRRSKLLGLPEGISKNFPDGFHQIVGVGDVTLIDFKKSVSKFSMLIPHIIAKINPFYKPF